MPEEVTPDAPEAPEKSDAPESGPEEGTTATEQPTDWEKSYQELRSAYNERDQEISQYRDFVARLSDPNTQAEVLAQFGLDIENEEPDYAEPEDEIKRELADIKSFIQSQQEAAAEAELAELEQAYLDQEFAKLSDHDKLSAQEREVILNLAHAYPDTDGLPDVSAAFDALKGAGQALQGRYLESKKAPALGVGTAGTEKIDLSNSDERVKYAAQIIEAERAAEAE